MIVRFGPDDVELFVKEIRKSMGEMFEENN